MVESKEALLVTTILNSQVVLRMCLINPRTTLNDVKETLNSCNFFAKRNSLVDDEVIISTTMTDGGGRYLFEGLSVDDGDGDCGYIVRVTDVLGILDGMNQTYDERPYLKRVKVLPY